MGALQRLYVAAAKESAAIIGKSEKAVRASRAPSAAGDLEWLARHRAWVLKYEREVAEAHGVPEALSRWFRPLLAHDLACGHRASRSLH
jgi:hypothetical protein